MSIESLVGEIQRMQRESEELVAPPATDESIVDLLNQFQDEFAFALPDAYLRILRVSDGMMFDGLTIWPTHANGKFRESLIDANRDLREMVEESMLFFGKRDDILFVWDPTLKHFAAVEMFGLGEWETFKDADTLITFMLERVVDDDVT